MKRICVILIQKKYRSLDLLLEEVGQMGAFVLFENVKKVYKTGEVEIMALHDVNFEVGEGEFCVIVGEIGRASCRERVS